MVTKAITLGAVVLLIAGLPSVASAAAGTDHGAVGPILFGLALLVISAKAGGRLAERMGQPSVLGELLAGIAQGNLLPLVLWRGGIAFVRTEPTMARLAPGEILVCPGTDPALTPLSLAAGGLVTEVGGMMTHGSVVAREVGIPAVVGVHQATSRLKDGQRMRVDGTAGRILILEQNQN